MISDKHKEKTYQAITYFTENTGMCYKKKLFKLLFLFDSEHFRETGRTVTGLDYFAWAMGPVPPKLDEEMDIEESTLRDRFEIHIDKITKDIQGIRLESKTKFDERYFSDRQIDLLKDLSERFLDATGAEMEKFTHREGSPWYRVWEMEKRFFQEIPSEYFLDGLDKVDRKNLQEIALENQAFIINYT